MKRVALMASSNAYGQDDADAYDVTFKRDRGCPLFTDVPSESLAVL